jgi:ribokinase
LSITHQIVADAVLGLEVLRDSYRAAGLEDRLVARLYSLNVGVRREVLLACWTRLHEALDTPAPMVPSDRQLRGQLEQAVLLALAQSLVSTSSERLISTLTAVPTEHRPSSGRLVVIGGAAMDVSMNVRALPTLDTSEEAHDCTMTPGGKGVTQAVAAARLGMDTTLVAAVGDDAPGQEIINLLKREGVDTRFIKRVSGARTPVTSVVNVDHGHNIALNWRNEREVRLEPYDLDRLADQLIGADVVQLTFEPPAALVQHTLVQLLGNLDVRPITIVSAGPPYRDTSIGGQALAQIDFLVAHQWELAQFAKERDLTEDPADLAARMLSLGLGALCVPLESGCAVYSHQLGRFSVPTFPTLYRDPAGARDAFCAALGLRLWEHAGVFSPEIALWATAAMAAVGDDRAAPTTMPRRRHIEAIISRSRFDVRPKPPTDPPDTPQSPGFITVNDAGPRTYS